jgi:carbon monoxide dehydrogenase subunit G
VKLTNEFTVGADVDTVWRTLLDMEGVAGCLPGATIEATDQEDTYKGSMRMKIGPMTVAYEGTATLSAVDEAARRAVISLRAREARGQGTALATITNVVEQADGGTRVRAETDLKITGPQARFGRGVMEDVASRVLSDFSSRLEQQCAAAEAPAAAAGAQASPPPPDEDAMDLGALLSESRLGRYARVGLPVLAVLALLALLAIIVRRRQVRGAAPGRS